jgi:hypothetical protein
MSEGRLANPLEHAPISDGVTSLSASWMITTPRLFVYVLEDRLVCH